MEPKILKDCPYCGASVELRHFEASTFHAEGFYVSCNVCRLHVMPSKQAALADWNTRAGEDAMQAEIVRLKAEIERLETENEQLMQRSEL